MAKKNSVRLKYHLQQLVPVLSFSVIFVTATLGFKIASHFKPEFSNELLDQNLGKMKQYESTMKSLNTQKKNLLSQKVSLEQSVTELKKKREDEGSLRFYTNNLPAYCRYVEFRADNYAVDIVKVNIMESENKVEYVIVGKYDNLIQFMSSLETREIYYIENFKLLPSFSNDGSYISFTANFNLNQSILDRYEKKVSYDELNQDTVEEIPTTPTEESDSMSVEDVDSSTAMVESGTTETPVEQVGN